MSCPDDIALSRAVDDDTRGASFDGHLRTCARCRARRDHLVAVRGALAALPVPAADGALAADVMARIDRSDRAARRDGNARAWRLAGVGALAGAALTALVVGVGRGPDAREVGTFTARGGEREHAVEVATLVSHGDTRAPLAAGAVLEPGFALSFRVLRRAPGERHLMIFGCDAAAELHWAVPAWDDAATDPAAPRVDPATPVVDVPTALAPDAPAGDFTLIALTSATPLTVKAVERDAAAIQSCAALARALAERPDTDLTVTRVTVRGSR